MNNQWHAVRNVWIFFIFEDFIKIFLGLSECAG